MLGLRLFLLLRLWPQSHLCSAPRREPSSVRALFTEPDGAGAGPFSTCIVGCRSAGSRSAPELSQRDPKLKWVESRLSSNRVSWGTRILQLYAGQWSRVGVVVAACAWHGVVDQVWQARQRTNGLRVLSGTIIRGTLKTPNSQLVTPISIKLQRPDGHD
jgi:hypothetical protein